MAQTPTSLITAEEFAAMPETENGEREELVAGEIVRMPPPGNRHGEIVLNIGSILRAHVRANGLGRVMAEAGFLLSDDPATVRAPDSAFLAAPKTFPESGYYRGSPDLAVEVLSPSQTVADMLAKAEEYFAAGGKEVWVIDPDHHVLYRCTASGAKPELLTDRDVLCTPLFEGLEIKLAEIFE